MKFFRAFEIYSTPKRPGLLPVSRSWFFQAIREGRFPAPNIQLSERIRVWDENTLSDYLQGKKAA